MGLSWRHNTPCFQVTPFPCLCSLLCGAPSTGPTPNRINRRGERPSPPLREGAERRVLLSMVTTQSRTGLTDRQVGWHEEKRLERNQTWTVTTRKMRMCVFLSALLLTSLQGVRKGFF